MTSQLPTHPLPRPTPGTPTGVVYTGQRAAAPVYRTVLPSGSQAWVVTRYDDVRAVLSDQRFSRNLLYPGAPCMIKPGDFSTGERSILNLDPPDHTRLRRLVAQAFTMRRIEALRGRIEQITSGLLDDLAAMEQPADLIEAFAFPLPTVVICEVLGVPYDERERFRAWSNVLVTPMQNTPDDIAAAGRSGAEHMRQLIARKREHPGEDLLSRLIEARDEGDRLAEDELVDLGTQLLSAGHETTVGLIANSVVLLMRHPEQLAALRGDPSLVDRAIEEVLRYESPAGAALLRVATADVEIGGVTIRKGEAVVPMTSSANFDETEFADPERFDITRRHNPHVGFGYGIHFCIGAPLSRIEGQVALRGLLDRFPGLRLAVPNDQIVWGPELVIRRPVAVPIAW
ncbi:cytochrome P450 family protein [Flindersiella endophytica]